MDRGVAAEAEIHGVAERQQAGLSEQQVERQREHGGDAHLRQQRAAEIGVEAGHVRQHEQQRDREPAAIGCAAPTRHAARPMRPRADRVTPSARSYVARAEQAARPHDQHQHQQQVRNDRRRRRELDRQQLVDRRRARDGNAGARSRSSSE